MKVVKVRSPFIIEINEPTQTATKIELFIWNNGDTEPTTPTYTLSKPIATPTQIETYYNVSNFVKEYIDNINPVYPNWLDIDSPNNFALFRVKTYYKNDEAFILLDNELYVGVNGFTNYMDGLQVADDTYVKLLFNSNIKNNYQSLNIYTVDTIQYLNLLVDFVNDTDQIDIIFNNIEGGYSVPTYITGLQGIYMLKIPISLIKVDSNFDKGCKIDISFTPDGGRPIEFDSVYTYPICEPKYTPVLCDFINRHGGWQTLTFYKAQTNNITTKSDDYKLMSNDVNYNPLLGQGKSFNFRGTQNVTLNTGWIDENYSELITDLLLSETVLLDKKPVNVKTQNTELKTKLKNKMINYTIEFEYNFNLINDVV